jgi:hypothetical protein
VASGGSETAKRCSNTVVIATDYGSVYRWTPARRTPACSRDRLAGRDFTRVEWEEAFGNRPYHETCPQT